MLVAPALVAAITVCAVVAGTLVQVGGPTPASAVALPAVGGNPAITTGFEIEGNKVHDGAAQPASYDWDDVLDGTPTTGVYTTPQGYPSTGIIDATYAVDNSNVAASCSSGTDGTAFGTGSKIDDNPWNIIIDSTNNKSDGCTGAAAYEVVNVAAGGEQQLHYILYGYWTRLEGNGDMTTYQILTGPDPGRCDDFLLQFDYNSAGGGSTAFSSLGWNGGCEVGAAGTWTVLVGPSNLPSAGAVGVNTDVPQASGDPQTFGESAVDLTAAGIVPENECVNYTTEGFISRTGNSPSGATIDYVGYADPLVIANCNSLKVSKASSPAGVNTASTFGYVVNQADGLQVHDATLSGGSAVDTDVSLNSITSTISIGQTHTWNPVIAEPDYQVSEVSLPANWQLKNIVCTYTDLFGTGGLQSVTLYENGASTGNTLPIFPYTLAPAPSCTMTNTTSGITVSKVALGSPGTNFDFTVNGAPVTVPGGATSAFIPFAPGTPVTISETMPAATPNWQFQSAVCDNPAATTGGSGSVTVTTIAESVINCTFTNRQLGRIVIVKNVAGADGTFNFSGNWDGTPAITGGAFPLSTTGGTASRTSTNVTPGSYTVSEEALPAGYEFKDLTCQDSLDGTASTVAGQTGTINLDPGETVTCIYGNSEFSRITVDKVTSPAGSAKKFDFSLTAPGGGASSFAVADADAAWDSGLISAGTYSLSEATAAGWQLTSLDCGAAGTVNADVATITLQAGATVNCVATNTAKPGSVQLTKTVTDVASGYSWGFDAVLSGGSSSDPLTQQLNNADPVANWKDLEVGASYTLAETLPANWTGGVVQCDGLADESLFLAGFQFTVTPGLELSCSVTNRADPASVQIEKIVNGVSADYPWSFDVSLDAGPANEPLTQQVTGTNPVAEWTGLLAGQQYTLTESLPDGWTASAITCTGVTDAAPGTPGLQFVADPGMALDCSVTNTATAGSGTLTKRSVGADGSFEYVLEENGTSFDTFTVTTASGTGVSGFDGLVPGETYSITEQDPGSSWIAGTITCEVEHLSGDTESVDPSGFEVSPGDVITCAQTNTAKGQIRIVKNVAGADGTFDFTGDWNGTPAIVANTFGITTNGGTGEQLFVDVAAGTYTVTEDGSHPGYEFVSLACIDTQPGGTSSVVNGSSATINLDPGEIVTCTYGNSEFGEITVDKVTDPAGYNQDFDFTLVKPAGADVNFSLSDTDALWTSGDLSAGNYTLTEADLPGWSLANLDCGTGITVSGSTATIVLAPGKTVNCVYTNEAAKGTLSLEKTVTDVAAGFPWSFDAVLSGGGSTDPLTQQLTSADPVASWDGLTVGETYTVEEVLPAGWSGGSVVCGALADADPGTEGFQFVVTPALALDCTVSNTPDPVDVTVTKTVAGVSGNYPWSFNLTISGGPTTEPAVQTLDASDDTAEWSGLLVGESYTITESLPLGWSGGPIACVGLNDGDPGTAGFQFQATPGLSLDCALENTAEPVRATLNKQAIGGDGSFSFELSENGTAPLSFTLLTNSGIASAPIPTLTPGNNYSLAETDPGSAWIRGSLSCEVTHLGGATEALDPADFSVEPGDSVTCTQVNTAKGTIVIEKEVQGSDAVFGFEGGWVTAPAGAFSIVTLGGAGSSSYADVVPGRYNVTETPLLADYEFIGLECVDSTLGSDSQTAGATATINLDPGETVTCTYTNRELSRITVDKVTDPAGYPQAFDITVTDPNGDPTALSLSDTDAAWDSGLIQAGDYAVNEPAVPGWNLSNLDCGEDGVQSGTGAEFTLEPGSEVNCVFTNTAIPTDVSLTKQVTGSTAGVVWSFDMSLSGGFTTSPLTQTVTEANAVANWAGLIPGVAYTLTESSPSGWNLGVIECVGLADADQGAAGFQFIARPGLSLNCSVTNEAIAPKLTLVKNVDRGNTGDTTPASAWTLSAVGPETISGSSGSVAVTAAALPVGSYALSEVGPSGYDASNWLCDNGVSPVSNTVSLELGDDVTCVVTNTAIAPTLTLVKDVDNEHGGMAVPNDWTLGATGPVSISGKTGDASVFNAPVQVGAYTLAESTATAVGYALDSLNCVVNGAQRPGVSVTSPQLTLVPGDQALCVFTNVDLPGTLTLQKVVDGAAAGSAVAPADWTLTATPSAIPGQPTVSGNGDPSDPGGVNAVTVAAGVYQLSETGPDGFEAGTWICPGGQVDGNTVTVPNGGNVICQITNTALVPKLTLVKVVDRGETGSMATASDWVLGADGPTPVNGTSGSASVTEAPVQVGTYTLGESVGPEGYTASDWVCTGTGTQDGAEITLAEGQNATCTITNTAQPASWSVSKSSNPPSGTTVDPGDEVTYTLTLVHTGGVYPASMTVTDVLTDVVDDATLVGAPVATSGSAVISVVGAATILTWNVSDFSGPLQVSYTERVNADAWDAHLVNVLTVPSGAVCEGECVTDHPTPSWTLEKSSDPASGSRVDPASVVTYTLDARNDSEADVIGAVATDDLSGVLAHASLNLPLPAGLTQNPSQPDELIWQLPDLAVGGAATVSYSVTVNANASNVSLRNVAVPGDGGNCVQNCSTTHEVGEVDLSIVKSHAAIEGGAVESAKGDKIAYEMRVTNKSDTAAVNVLVSDPLPVGLTMEAGSVVAPSGWNVSASTDRRVEASFAGPFGPGDTVVITFIAIVGRVGGAIANTTIPDIVNTACVSSDAQDANTADNCESDPTPVKSVTVAANAVCVQDAPLVDYAVTPSGVGDTPKIALIWWTKDGYAQRDPSIPASDEAGILADGAKNVNYVAVPADWKDGQTINGKQLWPGAAVDANGRGIAWPGWRQLSDGSWKLDPTAPFYDLRGETVAEIRINPSSSATTIYPPATPDCTAGPRIEPPVFKPTPLLALTGATDLPFMRTVSGALLLLAAGIALADYRRGRRSFAAKKAL